MACGKSEVRTGRENRHTVPPARETLKSSLPFTHKPHTGLVQVNGFPQGLSPSPDLCQLTRQLLHQGQQFSSDTVSLERIEEADSEWWEAEYNRLKKTHEDRRQKRNWPRKGTTWLRRKPFPDAKVLGPGRQTEAPGALPPHRDPSRSP